MALRELGSWVKKDLRGELHSTRDVLILERTALVARLRRKCVPCQEIPATLEAIHLKNLKEGIEDNRPYINFKTGKRWSISTIDLDLKNIRQELLRIAGEQVNLMEAENIQQLEEIKYQMSMANEKDSPAARARSQVMAIREQNRMLGITMKKGDFTKQQVLTQWQLFTERFDTFLEIDLPNLISECYELAGGGQVPNFHKLYHDNFLSELKERYRLFMVTAGVELQEQVDESHRISG